MKLNYGCGEIKLEGFVNLDCEESVKPDIVHDIKKAPLPFLNEEVEIIHCIHNIEHLEHKFWPILLSEFHRVLSPNGELYLAYPEFSVCAMYFLENHRGRKDLWRATLYGRQLYPGDYHVVPMVTSELIQFLQLCGFKDFKHAPEPDEEWNTFLACRKGEVPISKEDILRKEIFFK